MVRGPKAAALIAGWTAGFLPGCGGCFGLDDCWQSAAVALPPTSLIPVRANCRSSG